MIKIEENHSKFISAHKKNNGEIEILIYKSEKGEIATYILKPYEAEIFGMALIGLTENENTT